MLSPSKIHKELGVEKDFKQWLEDLTNEYEGLKRDGVISKNLNMIEWLNIQYEKNQLSADSLLTNVGDIFSKAVNKAAPQSSVPESSNIKPVEKTIIGLKPVVFYAGIGVAALGAFTIVWLKYQKYKKS